ncbi:MAG: beta-N-acetylhexosaminidase [Proteobacteria bacterium]|nr:beta-N-acetylhexosaminidase [Pseudomonadota bacterium]MDE3208458.1 beta-N-acetylhexosaminidase [Pseudomonadota bacterium]
MSSASSGFIMLDIVSTSLSKEDQRRLTHPMTGGVILFTRNFIGPDELDTLIRNIRELRSNLLVAVDHEGGRVQRFREGFTPIPAMSRIGRLSLPLAKKLAFSAGYVMGYELGQHDIDFSFAPVLDIDFRRSSVIGDRSFSSNPFLVSELSHYLIEGLHATGMKCCGKHFPGHGYAVADSHLSLPVDSRSRSQIESQDLIPYRDLIALGLLDSVMPAHVLYTDVDSQPAGFSKTWLKDILRNGMKFDGVIFSDDLSMEGAAIGGNMVERTQIALDAGCDMVLICNYPEQADLVLDYANQFRVEEKSTQRLMTMYRKINYDHNAALRYHEARKELSILSESLERTHSNDIVGNL